MYKLKSILRRGLYALSAAVVVTGGFLPAALTHADALNPLTQRSLTLSSSSPGWDYTDGSGNSTYAPPNSGANGRQTGNTFAFHVSTDSSVATGTGDSIKAFTFQYCTLAAGTCTAPGNDVTSGSSRPDNDAAHQTDLNVVDSTTPAELTAPTYASDFNTTSGDATGIPAADDSLGEGNFAVETYDSGSNTWSQSTGWTMAVSNNEDGQNLAGGATGKNNFITLTNSTGLFLTHDQPVKVVFFATNGNYVTNPGAGAFFVKINDYTTETAGAVDTSSLTDGGVTVANVVNQSIEIQTKVLETMDFSVGTVDPDTLSEGQLSTASGGALSSHGQCNPILPSMDASASDANVLQMGDTSSENSLSTSHTYSTHSYWRLSSNSSAGATVYYSGDTLSNTEGNQIQAIGTQAKAPSIGTPQFGLALDTGASGSGYPVDYTTESTAALPQTPNVDGLFENGADITANTQGVDPTTTSDTSGMSDFHPPALSPMIPASAANSTTYGQGKGNVNSTYGSIDTAFAFDPNSNVSPVPIATDAGQVVDCVTAKVRYIANIAATTPAGIYTTKVNYIAAPQY